MNQFIELFELQLQLEEVTTVDSVTPVGQPGSPALTINIPKPGPPATPTPPKREKQPDSSPKVAQVEETTHGPTVNASLLHWVISIKASKNTVPYPMKRRVDTGRGGGLILAIDNGSVSTRCNFFLADKRLTGCMQATVREDYSANGDAWSHFPHEQARSRAYRWGEDGIAGISDNHQRLCFGLSLWNGEDPILKERLFGVTGHQGNHGEDVKELYYYLDSTPTHSYMKFLYKYPQRRYPYEELVSENQNRNRDVTEYEILDTDAFEGDRYWDVFVEVRL